MIVRIEQENVSPQAEPLSPSNPCMVLRGGTIPASLQSFPGMEHDRGLYNGLSQDPPSSNGIADLAAGSNLFDDEREIEAVAAASEAQLKPTIIASTTTLVPVPVPPVIIPPTVPAKSLLKDTLSPLHINVTDCLKTDAAGMSSRESDLSRNGFSSQKKSYPRRPSGTIKEYPVQRPSTSSTTAPVIMGPPTNSNAPVLLSPAGNLHNGYQRISSGDSAPNSPGFLARPMPKYNQSPHPLAVHRSALQNARQPGPGPSLSVQSRPPSTAVSPQNGRKDNEMTRRRALVDRIGKSRGPEYMHLMPQVEGLTTTQTSILLRKHRGSLQSNGMPLSLQRLIDCGDEPDRSTEQFVKKINETNQKRVRHNDLDELTDISDLEDDLEDSQSQERKKTRETPQWTSKRMRYCGMLSRAETLLAEKIALLGMLKNQQAVMDVSCGVRFAGEEMITRRRRQLNGTYYLYDKSPFRRTSPEQFGCARAMPIQSWTKRKPHKNVFEDKKDEMVRNSMNTVKPAPNPNEKWVATAQYNTVSHMTSGEKREVAEYDYEEYKAGEGLQQVNELSSQDPMEFVALPDFTPFEERQIAYMHRLSVAPSCVIRKKHGRAIYFETDDRKNASEENAAVKVKFRKKVGKKKERKRLEDASSEEEVEPEESGEGTSTRAKKKGRGRPAARKKNSRASMFPHRHDGLPYLDYLFEDFMNEDINVKQLPTAVSYAHIRVPEWYKISENYWDNVNLPSTSDDNKPPDDLLLAVAKDHHKLMHQERERVRRETEKKRRQARSAAATPAYNCNGDDDTDYPPFDMRQFQPSVITSRRRYASVQNPFEPRNFLNNSHSPE
ncbi:unnamed protein product [Caenorhabditis sp. 36 PRJEB53466]|nr:unnamed protein product [Caenorhabditis sp. 36 PRJEB53466]